MLKKLLIPVLALTAAALACGGSSRDSTDGGAGEAGAGGSPAGAGGSPTDASTAGADGSTLDADGPTLTGLNRPVAGPEVVCNLETFCSVYVAFCDTTAPGYTSLAECQATYAAVGAANPTKQQCESYHLCNAIYDTGDDRALHCGHAAGGGTVCDPQPL